MGRLTRLTVKLFGPQALEAGAREVDLHLAEGGVTVTELRRLLAESQPAIAATLPGSRIAINHEFAGENDVVRPGDEVAVIGMLSGG